MNTQQSRAAGIFFTRALPGVISWKKICIKFTCMTRSRLLCLLILVSFHGQGFCQQKEQIQKSWIAKEFFSIEKNKIIDSTTYKRFIFIPDQVYICFSPAGHNFLQPWSLEGNRLICGKVHYIIESITDTSLVLVEPGYQRITFAEENNLNCKEGSLVQVGEYNSKPLYKQTKYTSPRYLGGSLHTLIMRNVDNAFLEKPGTLSISYIVTETGAVENIQVLKSISDKSTKAIVAQIKSTSSSWSPATFCGKTIQVEMVYTIQSRGLENK
jgi:hypothetical protein